MIQTLLKSHQRKLSLKPKLNISLRFMYNGSCESVSRATYNFLKTITHPHMLTTINSNNKKPLTNILVHYALRDPYEAIQHKAALSKHVINQKFPGRFFHHELCLTYIIQITKHNA